MLRPPALGIALLALAASVVCGSAAAQPQTVKIGAGSYTLSPRAGDEAVPSAPMRTPAMMGRAAQTNQWYSSLIFSSQPQVLYAHPLTYRATTAGLEMALAVKQVVPTERRDTEIHYPHRDPIVISATDFEPQPARLAKATDWAIDIEMARGIDRMLATIAHGSPYAYFQLSRGDVRVRLPAAGQQVAAGDDARILALRIGVRSYALFGPSGVRWEQVSASEWIGRLPAGKGYFSAAALPDDQPQTLQLLARHAYAFLEDTRVDWRYDPATSQVETRFTATTRTMEGPDQTALLGLYPHQWFRNPAITTSPTPAFDSIRGPIRLLAAREFKTVATYPGFVPFWPGITESDRLGQLRDVMKTDLRNARRMMLEIGNGPYWQGKGLQRIVKLMDVVEQQGDQGARDELLKLLRTRIESWFSGESRKTYFHYDKGIGTVVAYPEEYFSVQQLNDHHFHYGYWIRAVAEIALRDPAWAARERWGGMVDLLAADIATTQRGRADFPFLRHFDPYEGHSWASGIGLGEHGNNQEASSEAINAWAGLILWGEITGNRELRDAGIYLFTTEIEAALHYWFDIHGLVLAPEYKNVEVSMLFGGKYAHNTWWTDEPRQIKGINLLPITTASTYLGRDPRFVTRSLATLKGDTEIFSSRLKRADPPDIWQDIFAKYLALADPAQALGQWDRWGAVELGDSRSHTLHWLLSLNEMGLPDPAITADTTLYSVFKRADGRRTYLAYNATAQTLVARFSDGTMLEVAPRTLARTSRP